MLALCKSSSRALYLSLLLALTTANAGTAAQREQAATLIPDTQAGKKIWALCAACHGEDGSGSQHGEFPSIAGQHRQVIVKQILDIQSKQRINPTMYPFVDMLTLGGLQGLVNIAAYTASLPANPAPVTGPGENLDKGRELYQANCTACHGKAARGQGENYYPNLTHQHYPYLVRELGWIRDNIRKNSNPLMVQILKNFSDGDIQAVADYLSRLR